MNEKHGNRGPNWGLLLLVPAVVIIAKAAKRRRAMWESGYGYNGRFGGALGQADPREGFRLPPKIEWMLDAWHTRAHQTTESTEATTI